MNTAHSNSSPTPKPQIGPRRPGLFVRSLRSLLYTLLAFFLFVWGINILGVSTIFNSPDIHYSGIDANTGKRTVVKGCRPERLRPDSSCNKSIDFDTIVEAFPRWSR